MEASVRLLASGMRGLRVSSSSRISTSTSTSTARAFTTTTSLHASDYSPTPTPPSSRSTISSSISTVLDESLDLKKGQHATRQSRFPGKHPAPATTQSSISNFARTLTAPGRSSKSQSPSTNPSSAALDIDAWFNNPSDSPPPSGVSPESELPTVKLNPTVGRTIKVDMNRGMDVGRAFRTLEMSCARNSVRKDFMRQRFHERPGLKRKRLKGERWRRNFKAGFKETVALVVRMKRQGW